MWPALILLFSFPGDHSEGVTPVPIPNTAVKSLSADGTAWETAWESRTLPGLLFGEAHHYWWAFLLGGHGAGYKQHHHWIWS